MGRSPCCAKEGLNKGAWTAMEDKTLTEYITAHGEGKWRNLPKRAGLKRCGKSCRLRWLNYLRPDIKRGNITRDEEELIIRLHKLLGNRWSLIAGRLPGRTDNEIKNYWNTNIGKKVQDRSTTNSDANFTRHKPTNHQATEQSNPQVVVRTKASRCTKVFLPHSHPQIEQDTSNPTSQQFANSVPLRNGDDPVLMTTMGKGADHQFPAADAAVALSPFLNLDAEHSHSCEFMVDFKMDESFLSEFLNVDFSELYNSRTTNSNGEDLEGNSANAELAVDDHPKLHGRTDVQPSMAFTTDSEMDNWLIDTPAY